MKFFLISNDRILCSKKKLMVFNSNKNTFTIINCFFLKTCFKKIYLIANKFKKKRLILKIMDEIFIT